MHACGRHARMDDKQPGICSRLQHTQAKVYCHAGAADGMQAAGTEVGLSMAVLVAVYHALAPYCARQMVRGNTMQVASVGRLHTQLSSWMSQICVLPLAVRDARILGLSELLSSCCTGPATPIKEADGVNTLAWDLSWPIGNCDWSCICSVQQLSTPMECL